MRNNTQRPHTFEPKHQTSEKVPVLSGTGVHCTQYMSLQHTDTDKQTKPLTERQKLKAYFKNCSSDLNFCMCFMQKKTY